MCRNFNQIKIKWKEGPLNLVPPKSCLGCSFKMLLYPLKPRCWRKLLRITLPKTFQREKLRERDSYLKGLLGMIHPVVSGRTSYWSRLQRNRSWQSQNKIQKPPRKQTRRIHLVEGPRKSKYVYL